MQGGNKDDIIMNVNNKDVVLHHIYYFIIRMLIH